MAVFTRLATARSFPARISSALAARECTALLVAIGAWAAGVGAGGLVLWSYAGTPGPNSPPPAMWPRESGLPRGAGSTLVMFAHPHCPCTRASLRELERLLAKSGEALGAVIAFVEPPGMAAAGQQSSLWRAAAAIPGVNVVQDRDGAEARRFHAATSGTCRLYDAEGRLLFHGGITPARGHEGDSVGGTAILTMVSGRAADRRSPAFGCPLWTPNHSLDASGRP